MPGGHPEAHLPRALELGPDDGLVADSGVGVFRDGDPRAQVAAGVAVRVLGDGELREVRPLAHELGLFARAVRHDRGSARAPVEHALGQVADHPVRRGAEGDGLPFPVLHQDVAHLPLGEPPQRVEHDGSGGLGAEGGRLGDRVDLLFDVDEVASQGLQVTSQCRGHGLKPPCGGMARRLGEPFRGARGPGPRRPLYMDSAPDAMAAVPGPATPPAGKPATPPAGKPGGRLPDSCL